MSHVSHPRRAARTLALAGLAAAGALLAAPKHAWSQG